MTLEPSGRIDGEKMMSNVIDWIEDRALLNRQSLIECGWLETVEIEVGKVRVSLILVMVQELEILHADEILDLMVK